MPAAVEPEAVELLGCRATTQVRRLLDNGHCHLRACQVAGGGQACHPAADHYDVRLRGSRLHFMVLLSDRSLLATLTFWTHHPLSRVTCGRSRYLLPLGHGVSIPQTPASFSGLATRWIVRTTPSDTSRTSAEMGLSSETTRMPDPPFTGATRTRR